MFFLKFALEVAELNIPLHVARNFLDKDEMVEACAACAVTLKLI